MPMNSISTLIHSDFWAALSGRAMNLALQIIAAVMIFVIGRWLLARIRKFLGQSLAQREVDPTLARYIQAGVNALLYLLLAIAILSQFGVQTTSLAALVAGAGVAIGAAWAGLLSNFAAGVFLILLRPFKVGDGIKAGGVEGSVELIGLFATTINANDGVRAIVGNSKIFADTIFNYTANPTRRIERRIQLAHGVDVTLACSVLMEKISALPQLLHDPALTVRIGDLNERGPIVVIAGQCNAVDFGELTLAMAAAAYATLTEHQLTPPALWVDAAMLKVR